MPVYRSLLFVPGSRHDLFEKAAGSGADTMIIDLEDAVLPDHKSTARTETLAWLGAVSAPGQGLRINSPRTAFGCADIAGLAGQRQMDFVDFVIVPKCEAGADLEIVAEAIGRPVALIAVIESGRGLANAPEIARQATGGILFGGVDYSASIGADVENWDAMLTARGLIAAACGAAGIPAYDVPHLAPKQLDDLSRTTRQAKAMGFSGRACIHPAQVDTVNAVFTPSADELAEARAILDAFGSASGGVALHKGKMIDRPVILSAQRLLARVRGSAD